LVFIDPGVKVIGAYYRDVLLAHLQTCYQTSGPRRIFYFSAEQCANPQTRRNHRNANKRRTRLHSSQAPTLWPPDSQDLNPVDHKVWSVVEEQVYHTPIHDVNYLKQRLQKMTEILYPVYYMGLNSAKLCSHLNRYW